ncbi:nitrile hydratase subunit beta [Roseovarius faecimaris]|uniref:Nitrile hydratase subunit beta n=2 Tax=Roseovarius faecimaris TaxID=2494550 RepID=A0A6I6IQH2_9RHOB|nr:nitrile hydratase subunit beta [Roseovarius faecimaris]
MPPAWPRSRPAGPPMARPTMGSRVRVKALCPPGHVRAPWYLRGKTGVIERALGEFGNPEQLAYGVPAEKKPLYRVRFTMSEIWGNRAENPDDTIDAEIYGHWLEEV